MPEPRRCKLVTQHETFSLSTVPYVAHLALSQETKTFFTQEMSDDRPSDADSPSRTQRRSRGDQLLDNVTAAPTEETREDLQ